MHYSDGTLIQVGDVVKMGGSSGIVVCNFESNICISPYNISEWSYLEQGILVDFQLFGIIHMEAIEIDLEFVSRADKERH